MAFLQEKVSHRHFLVAQSTRCGFTHEYHGDVPISCVNVYQRVNLYFPMVFLCLSYFFHGFPMFDQRVDVPHGFSAEKPWVSPTHFPCQSSTGTTSGDRSEMKKVRPCQRAPKALPGGSNFSGDSPEILMFSQCSSHGKCGVSLWFPENIWRFQILEISVSMKMSIKKTAISIVSHEKTVMGVQSTAGIWCVPCSDKPTHQLRWRNNHGNRHHPSNGSHQNLN